ncbi:arginine--tRNA ligase [Paenibacillus nanensis]|uniref:Arginine--tRNA ligase n=1 Tax=Paenibacillus nanensis TaxID=393251 RepID=A0A3A1UY85_9BACL|nr:arginine--tRNA ligase [Paenibacillus nanensis]RIX53185.1 arginine--tRNA ligase [Paenibacillus nanensis]
MQKYKRLIAGKVSSLYEGISSEDIFQLIEYPANAQMGDLSVPCFKLSKQLRKSPAAVAEELKAAVSSDAFERIEAVSGYLNFYLNKPLFAESVLNEIRRQKENYGSQKLGEGKTIVIDYSSPNIAKPFHVAHLRSTVIGSALYRIHSFLGYECVGVNHLGDWGTQFGKLIVAYRMWGSRQDVEQRGIDELLRLYVKFHDEAERNASLENEARAWFAKMEQGNEEALALWRWFVDISLEEFKRIYDLLGIRFDSYAGESFYNDKMDAVIRELKSKDLLEEDDGASLVRLDDYGMPPALILKKDGSSLYHTRDIAAAIYRKEAYSFDKAIYVTDYAQNLHFQQWFKVVELMGYEWSGDLVHVAFGRVSLEGMSLSTRKGNVIKLEEVLGQAIAKTKKVMEARNHPLPNIDEVSRQVGVGAVIFHDLSASRIKDVVFSWEQVLSFEGETGPYVQYTHARICSILAKAKDAPPASESALAQLSFHLQNDATNLLLRELSVFGERVELAAKKLEPSILARYLIDLAQAFNRFYHECPILNAEDKDVREARLALCEAVRMVLKSGLHLIGLEAPKQM